MQIIQEFKPESLKELGDPDTNYKNWKKLFRNGIPDEYKRQAILTFFNMNPEQAEN